jgi:hypothetical protein
MATLLEEASMSDYIIWVQRSEDSWERLDTPTLELARMVFDRQRAAVDGEVAMTRLVNTAGPALVRAPGTTPVLGMAAVVPPIPASAPATPTVRAGMPDAAASASVNSAADSISDLEIRLLNQLKEAFRELDSPTVWRIVRWAMEYAKARK